VLSASIPTPNLVPLPAMAVTLSVLTPLQIEYDRTGVLRDFLKATSVVDKLASSPSSDPPTGSPQTTLSRVSVY
jgi:hypothetical protein